MRPEDMSGESRKISQLGVSCNQDGASEKTVRDPLRVPPVILPSFG